MARGFYIRLACAGALLVTGMSTLAIASRFGAVHVDAGEMAIVFGGGETGLTFDAASRGCPPDCDFAINWRPAAALTRTGF